ncbi:MAG: DNA polymerase I [Pseudomonadales bacterium]|nr:DNA polymerase I [Pseudomonadales bacterium]MBO6596573.1 DNA polymerase I [Pseudomonadales bacterium]MBO6656463.1 DNA polymerase I [Pseudomonadales bacterium]MBO6823438.1 DNA polymerase I [Pseudomonadales bacterium]
MVASHEIYELKKDFSLVLIDGSSYLFRAYHALPQLVSSKGQPTGAIKGVISMIRKLMADYPDSHIAVVFDAKGKTFRNEIYKEYKANRPPMPDELRSQIAPIHDIIRKMGLPLLIVDDVEADDVIGTLAQQANDKKMDVLISTGDKDMAQLVTPHVTLINTMNDALTDEDGVAEKFGVRPDQIIDYLALVGDTSDNIPGVPKCGPKTAVKWLTEYVSLQGVMDNADQIKGKVGENLRDSLSFLPMSYDLATIRKDVALEAGVDELVLGEPDTSGLLELFTELEFKPWVTELGDGGSADSATVSESVDVAYDIVYTPEALDGWVETLSKADLFAFDTETTSIDYMAARIVGLSFCAEAGKAAYVPIAHDYEGAPEQLSMEEVFSRIAPLLEDPERTIVGQNLKYDISVMANHGVEVKAKIFDTMLESYVLNSVASRHNMDDLALKYLGVSTVHFEDIAGKGAKQLTFNQIDIDKAGPYAAEDADITLRLHEVLWPKLEAEETLRSVYLDIELPLVPLLSRVEREGVLLDEEQLHRQSRELEKRLSELEQEAYGLAGEEFNLGSTKQLQQIFFEKLGLPIIKKTPKGQPSTAEPVLQELALDYPLPAVIMAYRGLSKLKSTYTDQLPKQIAASTGRIHTSYHQAVAATGRLSSTDPNLQNIPIRTEEGRRVRKAFVAPQGYKVMAADYSQIELRIMAHLSGDEGLVKAFKEGLDIHKATAAEVFGGSIDSVTDEHRRSAKAINFGLIYGMSAFGLARQLNISRGDAQDYIDLYFERYPGVRAYMDRTRALAAEQGYVETIYGRRLYLPEIKASNFQRRQAAERTAINAPMQGSAADIIKRAMIAVDQWLLESDLDTRMTMQVHDELVLEVPEARLDEVAAGVEGLMSGAAELSIPLVVEAGVGDNWDQAH